MSCFPAVRLWANSSIFLSFAYEMSCEIPRLCCPLGSCCYLFFRGMWSSPLKSGAICKQ